MLPAWPGCLAAHVEALRDRAGLDFSDSLVDFATGVPFGQKIVRHLLSPFARGY